MPPTMRVVRLDAVELDVGLAAHVGEQQPRRRHPDDEADAEQGEHLAHHDPEHAAARRAECQPDAQLLAPPGDHERHHAVEADRRQRRGEQAEAGGEQRDQSIGQQRLVQLPLQRLHAEDGHGGVDAPHFVAELAVERRGANRAADVVDDAAAAGTRDEHLSPHAFARALVELVFDDADDLDVQLRLRPVAPADVAADDVDGLEEVLGELPIDDGDARPAVLVVVPPGGLIGQPEVAAGQHLHAHRLEIPGRQRVHEGLHVLAVRGLVALDRHRAVPFVASEDSHLRGSRGADAGDRLDALEELVLEVRAARVVVAVQARIDLERDEVLGLVDAGVGATQVLQAAREQPGAEQQQEAEGDLRGDQALAQEQRLVAAGDRSDRVLQASATDRDGWRAAPAAGRRRRR